MSSRPGALAALSGGLLLGFATPPTLVMLGEWLVLPALAIWFAVATTSRRPVLHSYLFGCVHMAWFSWSVRHVMLPAYVAIVVIGGLYYALATSLVRRMPAGMRGFGFGLAVAGCFWLRAIMPEIHYPHGQPCHVFYEWPALMRCVAVGGEPLFNALLAWVAAAAFGLWRSWRGAVPEWGAARRRLLGALAVAAGVTVAGNAVVASAAASSLDERVELLVVEPGFRPDAMFELPPSDWRAWSDRFVEERLVAPTRAGLEGADEIELVLWPESSVQAFVRERQLGAAGASLALPRLPSADARLLVGANVVRGARSTPAAVLVGLPDGAILGYQAKQQLVPGGEFLPLLGALPDSWSGWLKEKFRAALGALPDCVAGEVRPPLRTARGAPFGALLCYDNAFLGPAAAQVEQGASFLVVLSNEAWYRGGGELQQLVAMTVVRACENAAPIVRCTMDGWTVWVDGEGRIAGGLPLDHAQPDGRARSMRVALTPGAGKPPLFGWLRYGSGPACGLLAVAGAALGWARRRRHRSPLR